MNGGTSKEIPPRTQQIASAAIKAGTQLIACGRERAAVAVAICWPSARVPGEIIEFNSSEDRTSGSNVPKRAEGR